MKKNKLIKSLSVVIVLGLIIVGLIEGFALFAPNALPIQSLFGGNEHQQGQEELYYTYIDSLEALDFKIRNGSDSKILIINKERQKYYRNKVESIRNKLAGNEPENQSAPTEQSTGNISSTILTALAIPIGILLVLIVIVIYLIRKKKPEPILPHEPKPSLTKRFDDAIEQANAKKQPRDSISTMLKTLNQTLEEKRAQQGEGDQPLGVIKEKKERQRVFAETNAMQHTQEIETIAPAEPERIIHKETGSGKIEIIPPETPINSSLTEDNAEESFEKEAQINTDVIKLARRGYTSSEIARRLRISQDQVDLIIRMQREE